MEQIDGQMMMDFTTDELILQYRTEDRLRSDYNQVYSSDMYSGAIPAGSEVIVQDWRYDRRGRRNGKLHYRTRLEYHSTVSGPTPRLISEPDGDWPSVPPWQPDGSGVQWVYPNGSTNCYFVRRAEK